MRMQNNDILVSLHMTNCIGLLMEWNTQKSSRQKVKQCRTFLQSSGILFISLCF